METFGRLVVRWFLLTLRWFGKPEKQALWERVHSADTNALPAASFNGQWLQGKEVWLRARVAGDRGTNDGVLIAVLPSGGSVEFDHYDLARSQPLTTKEVTEWYEANADDD